jgi:hypothetical protein
MTRIDHLAHWFCMTRQLDMLSRRTISGSRFDQAFPALDTLQTLHPHGQNALGECRIHIAVQKTLEFLPLRPNSFFQFDNFSLARLKLRLPFPVDPIHLETPR